MLVSLVLHSRHVYHSLIIYSIRFKFINNFSGDKHVECNREQTVLFTQVPGPTKQPFILFFSFSFRSFIARFYFNELGYCSFKAPKKCSKARHLAAMHLILLLTLLCYYVQFLTGQNFLFSELEPPCHPLRQRRCIAIVTRQWFSAAWNIFDGQANKVI